MIRCSRSLVPLFLLCAAAAWTAPALAVAPQEESPAQESRDAKADALADQVMAAMGGEQSYNHARYLTWRFFGRRFHVWDKHTGDIRVEDGKGLVVIMNIQTMQGKAWQDGQPIEDPAVLKEKLDFGYGAWINDSYWLVMPYKLKDPGVNLVYSREDKMENGRLAHVLTLTFDAGIGLTPENKYEVFIDKETHLVEQWSFFKTFEDEEPQFSTPWAQWRRFGNIMLSDDRGKYKHTDVAVFDELPVPAFEGPDPISLTP